MMKFSRKQIQYTFSTIAITLRMKHDVSFLIFSPREQILLLYHPPDIDFVLSIIQTIFRILNATEHNNTGK